MKCRVGGGDQARKTLVFSLLLNLHDVIFSFPLTSSLSSPHPSGTKTVLNRSCRTRHMLIHSKLENEKGVTSSYCRYNLMR